MWLCDTFTAYYSKPALKIAFVNSLLSFSVEFINAVLVCLLNANSFTAIAWL